MNENWFVKIDEYLNGAMSREEKLLFESELANNEDLSSAFDVYRTVETEMRTDAVNTDQATSLKNSLARLNAKYFRSEAQTPVRSISSRYHTLFKISSTIAASVIVIVVVYLSFFQPKPTTRQIAADYIEKLVLSQGMGTVDSLELGIEAFQDKKYTKALQLFQGVYQNHPNNTEAKKNIGLTYLKMNQYDEALREFDDLARMKHLFSNSGMFLKAVTLMKRNREGDKEQAKLILREVVKEEADGSEQAAQWLKDWKD